MTSGKVILGLALTATVALSMGAGAARAQTCPCEDPNGNPPSQVNISGATLFADFFRSPASTNDHIDVDQDGLFGRFLYPPYVDQLAPDYPNVGCFLVQYRGVGSGNGLKELDTYFDGTGNPPKPDMGVPADFGLINRGYFWDEGVPGPWYTPANYPEFGGSPVPPNSVCIAVLDVPVPWFVQVNGVPHWTRNPGDPGYGQNPRTSGCGQSNKLKTLTNLNINTASPDALTVYDTQIAWVPIGIISNKGTGVQCLSKTAMQHLWLTGRLPNGENLVAATRDSGSGTRNGAMNSICVDPSWGRGDNWCKKIAIPTNLGWTYDALTATWFAHQATNLGGSSIMEHAVQVRRLAVGYTGLAGGSRAVNDAKSGKYELVDVINDAGCSTGTQCVRPSLQAILHNCDPDTGWQIGGPETFATVGSPMATDICNPNYPPDPNAGLPMDPNVVPDAIDQAAYIRNIVESIAMFAGNPPAQENDNMPGELLATKYILTAATDCVPGDPEPCCFEPNPDLNVSLQSWMEANHEWADPNSIPPYCSVNPANLVPTRGALSAGPNPPIAAYSDGSVGGEYYYTCPSDPNVIRTATAGLDLNERNRLAGDFLYDGVRDMLDIAAMVECLDMGSDAFRQIEGDWGGDAGELDCDVVIPEIIGDHNGDGNFDCEDVRYACDGLAIPLGGGNLDRFEGFRVADQKWFDLNGAYFFADGQVCCSSGTQIVMLDGSGAGTYQAGDAAYDVASADPNDPNAPYDPTAPCPGHSPIGHDCVVDVHDVWYVVANFGDFSDPDQAVDIDLSCDFNGDLKVDCCDLTQIVSRLNGVVSNYLPGPYALIESAPEMEAVLPKDQNNVILLKFECGLSQLGPVVVEDITDPNTPVDVSALFTLSFDCGDCGTNVLKLKENGQVLSDQTWYRITPGAGFTEAAPFVLDVCTLRGDGNNSGRVTTADYSVIKSNLGQRGECPLFADLNGSARVTTADYSVVKANLGHRKPSKP